MTCVQNIITMQPLTLIYKVKSVAGGSLEGATTVRRGRVWINDFGSAKTLAVRNFALGYQDWSLTVYLSLIVLRCIMSP